MSHTNGGQRGRVAEINATIKDLNSAKWSDHTSPNNFLAWHIQQLHESYGMTKDYNELNQLVGSLESVMLSELSVLEYMAFG